MNRFHFLKRLAAICLLTGITIGLVPLTNAQSMYMTRAKISRGLRREQSKTSPNGSLRVILQLDSLPTGQLNALLQRNGVRVRGNFADMGIMSLDLPADVLDELASHSEVNFLSQDEPVNAMGYVTATTGADAVRTQTSSTGGLLGTGLLSTTTTMTFDG